MAWLLTTLVILIFFLIITAVILYYHRVAEYYTLWTIFLALALQIVVIALVIRSSLPSE